MTAHETVIREEEGTTQTVQPEPEGSGKVQASRPDPTTAAILGGQERTEGQSQRLEDGRSGVAVELVRLDEVGDLVARILWLADPDNMQARKDEAYAEFARKQRVEAGEEEEPEQEYTTTEMGEGIQVRTPVLRSRKVGPTERLQGQIARIGGPTESYNWSASLVTPGPLVGLNRGFNYARYKGYLENMKEGKWWTTPDPVAITTEGQIINGQHRLAAALDVPWEEAEQEAIPFLVVVWGIDKRAALLMDEAKRNPNDRRDIALKFAEAVG